MMEWCVCAQSFVKKKQVEKVIKGIRNVLDNV